MLDNSEKKFARKLSSCGEPLSRAYTNFMDYSPGFIFTNEPKDCLKGLPSFGPLGGDFCRLNFEGMGKSCANSQMFSPAHKEKSSL